MGELKIVGMGPGDRDGMTIAADQAIREADVVVGYKRYVQLLAPLYPGKSFCSTGMTHEVARCNQALELAQSGRLVAMVCSGDAGVYAMAGLVYELSPRFPDVTIEVVPGVTAATSGAALLGAPIGHDFAVVSLSDRLTGWPVIERRLDAAAGADFLICLYNPSSHTRAGHLRRACDVLLRHKPATTVCGLASRIGRDGQSATVTTLGELREVAADMFTTVFIGNAETVVIDGKMVTPRGYATDFRHSDANTDSLCPDADTDSCHSDANNISRHSARSAEPSPARPRSTLPRHSARSAEPSTNRRLVREGGGR